MGPEFVGVDPQPVGTADLLVHKTPRRIPLPDTGLPPKGDAEQTELVVDEGPLTHGNGKRGHDPKRKFRRGDPFQVGLIGEKGKDLPAGRTKKDPGFEVVDAHGVSSSSGSIGGRPQPACTQPVSML